MSVYQNIPILRIPDTCGSNDSYFWVSRESVVQMIPICEELGYAYPKIFLFFRILDTCSSNVFFESILGRKACLLSSNMFLEHAYYAVD